MGQIRTTATSTEERNHYKARNVDNSKNSEWW